jgi:hypothetical protein
MGGLRKGPWTEEEDNQLDRMFNEFGPSSVSVMDYLMNQQTDSPADGV